MSSWRPGPMLLPSTWPGWGLVLCTHKICLLSLHTRVRLLRNGSSYLCIRLKTFPSPTRFSYKYTYLSLVSTVSTQATSTRLAPVDSTLHYFIQASPWITPVVSHLARPRPLARLGTKPPITLFPLHQAPVPQETVLAVFPGNVYSI